MPDLIRSRSARTASPPAAAQAAPEAAASEAHLAPGGGNAMATAALPAAGGGSAGTPANPAAPVSPAAPPGSGAADRGQPSGAAATEVARRSNPQGMTVALALNPTLADQNAEDANREAYANEATRREAISKIDPALWGEFRARYMDQHAADMDRLAQGLPGITGANPYSSVTGRERARVREAIVRVHAARLRDLVCADPALWRELNHRTVSQGQEFPGQARQFARANGAVLAEGGQLRVGAHGLFNNATDLAAQVQAVHTTATAAGMAEPANKVRNLAIFTHGWRSGMAGHHGDRDIDNPERLVGALSSALTADVHVALFACGTAGRRETDETEGSFADRIRDSLASTGHQDAVVMGHRGSGHTVGNESVSLFGAGLGQGQTRADPVATVPEPVRRRVRESLEVARGAPISTRGYNSALIYYYNQDFSFSVTHDALSDPSRLQREAGEWWERFAHERRAAVLQRIGNGPRRLPRRPGSPTPRSPGASPG